MVFTRMSFRKFCKVDRKCPRWRACGLENAQGWPRSQRAALKGVCLANGVWSGTEADPSLFASLLPLRHPPALNALFGNVRFKGILSLCSLETLPIPVYQHQNEDKITFLPRPLEKDSPWTFHSSQTRKNGPGVDSWRCRERTFLLRAHRKK